MSQDRIVLPVNLMTKVVVNADPHNLMHFLRLRLHPHAQWEIRVLAAAMLSLAEPHFPWTFEAFRRFKAFVIDQQEPTSQTNE